MGQQSVSHRAGLRGGPGDTRRGRVSEGGSRRPRTVGHLPHPAPGRPPAPRRDGLPGRRDHLASSPGRSSAAASRRGRRGPRRPGGCACRWPARASTGAIRAFGPARHPRARNGTRRDDFAWPPRRHHPPAEPGCQGLWTSRDPVPWVFGRAVVQPPPPTQLAKISDTGGVRDGPRFAGGRSAPPGRRRADPRLCSLMTVGSESGGRSITECRGRWTEERVPWYVARQTTGRSSRGGTPETGPDKLHRRADDGQPGRPDAGVLRQEFPPLSRNPHPTLPMIDAAFSLSSSA
jgi:hypothetical protein